MKNLTIKKCDDYDIWDKFIYQSPQHNFFSCSDFFRYSSVKHSLFFLMKNNEPLIGFPVFVDKKNTPTNIPFSYYQGLSLSSKFEELKYYRKYSWLRYCYENILNFLFERFGGFYMDLHPTIRDIRFLEWFFENNEKIKLDNRVKYTAIINNNEFDSIEKIRSKYRKDRLQDLKYAENQNFKIDDGCKVDDFIKLFEETYEKNNEKVSDDVLETIEYFFKDLKNHLNIISIKYKDKVIGSQLFFCDKYSAHAIAQVTDTNFMDKGVSSYLTDKLIKITFKKKIKYLDFNGCNSPNRADFKHSFGAEPVLFFRVTSVKA